MIARLVQQLPKAFYHLLRKFRFSLRLSRAVWQDARRYLTHSRTIVEATPAQLRAAIVAHYHVLEKGLGMPDRKAVFGTAVADALRARLEIWEARGYGQDVQIDSARSVLAAHAAAQAPVGAIPSSMFLAAETIGDAFSVSGGTRAATREAFLKLGRGDFCELVKARRSIRNFASTPITEDVIAQAIELAQQSPSVCNRQSCKVHWTTERDKIDALLTLQNGNRGFGHLAQGLFIVTSDLSIFVGLEERNQAWIDGGLFSMSLLYALSYLGLGACPLNWCVTSDCDTNLRESIGIPDAERVIMMIAFGHLPETFDVAVSMRDPITSVLHRIS